MSEAPAKPKLPDPCSFVVFGVTGDLTHRLITPALYNLAESGLLPDDFWRRLVIEKPFGIDLASARKLNAELLEIMDEHQIYRIDHYLGKETVQNILVLRFSNGMFEPIWNRNHIDHVQITVDETLDV